MVDKFWVECDQCGSEKTGNRLSDSANTWVEVWLEADKTVDFCGRVCLKAYAAAMPDEAETEG